MEMSLFGPKIQEKLYMFKSEAVEIAFDKYQASRRPAKANESDNEMLLKCTCTLFNPTHGLLESG